MQSATTARVLQLFCSVRRRGKRGALYASGREHVSYGKQQRVALVRTSGNVGLAISVHRYTPVE